MKIDFLQYPKKSHRKEIKIPYESVDLAEFMGIEFGDGGINNPWQVVITLNAEKDAEYGQYVITLVRKLFNIDAAIRTRGERTLQIVFSSTALVDFLVEKGAVRGNKIKHHFDIPNWLRGNEEYEKAFIRGLVDTDGCFYIHCHTIKGIPYQNIGFCFTSYSRTLLNSVADIFHKFGITPHITDSGRRIYLYSGDSVVQYLRTFGSANPRISKIYKEWKGAGVV